MFLGLKKDGRYKFLLNKSTYNATRVEQGTV